MTQIQKELSDIVENYHACIYDLEDVILDLKKMYSEERITTKEFVDTLLLLT